MHRRGFLKTRLPEPDRVRPHPSPAYLQAGQQTLPRAGRPCSGWSAPHNTPRQPRFHTPALLPKCCGNSMLWETFLEEFRTQTFFNQTFEKSRPLPKPTDFET